jgi:hypothetical protein
MREPPANTSSPTGSLHSQKDASDFVSTTKPALTLLLSEALGLVALINHSSITHQKTPNAADKG